MTLIKNRIIYLALFLFNYGYILSQNYVGDTKNIGFLELNKNNTFYLKYFHKQIDSGVYIIKNDTLTLNSTILAAIVNAIPCQGSDSIIHMKAENLSIYDSNGKLLRTYRAKIDSAATNNTVHGCKLEKGNIVDIYDSIYDSGHRKFFWSIQNYNCLNIIIDDRGGKMIYFDNYKMLVKGNMIKPIRCHSNSKFKLINDFDFPSMHIQGKNEKYYVKLNPYGIY